MRIEQRPSPWFLSGLSKSERGWHMLATTLPILLCVVLGVCGQLLLKRGMTSVGPLDGSATGILPVIWRVATSPYVIFGLVVYVFSTVFWLMTLSKADLSFAYPFVGLNQVLILVFSLVVLREQVDPMRIIGVLIITFGVLVVARS